MGKADFYTWLPQIYWGLLGTRCFSLGSQGISVFEVTCGLWKNPGYQRSRWYFSTVPFLDTF